MKTLIPILVLASIMLLPGIPGTAFADYTVTGRFQYQDREFDIDGFTGVVTPRPIRFAIVNILVGNTQIASGSTREDGSFSVGVSGSAPQLVSAICVTSSTSNILLEVRTASNGSYNLNGDFYAVASTSLLATGRDPVDFGTTLARSDTDAGKAFNIWDVVVDALQFSASSGTAGRFPEQKLTVSWSSDHSGSGSFFAFDGTNSAIYAEVTDCFNDTVIAHEVGHYIDSLYFYSDSPGGAHYLGDDAQDIRLSWSEGLATFLGSSSRKFKGYPTPEIYVSSDGKELGFSYELENLTGEAAIGSKTGSTNEVAVSAVLWDITDSDADYAQGVGDHDPMNRPLADVWKVLHEYLPTVTRPGISIETFWLGWLSVFNPGGADITVLQNTFAGIFNGVSTGMNGIEFVRDAQEPDDSPTQAQRAALAQPAALVTGPRVVISEVDLGTTDTVELYNAGNAEADLTGWSVEASAPSFSKTTFRLPAFKLAPGSFVLLSEASGVNTDAILYFNSNISWANGNDGACALKDGNGAGVDFVRWGKSSEPPPDGTSFGGSNPTSPGGGRNLARGFNELDTNIGSDWAAQTSTLGTYNLSGTEQHHTYYSLGDADYVVFTATAGRSYLAETFRLISGADTILDLISTDGVTVLATSDDFGSGRASRLSWVAPAGGTYYLRSRRFDGPTNFAQFGSYDLRIIASSLPFTLPLPHTFTVSQPGQGGKFHRISDALAAASVGDTIQILDNGIYLESAAITRGSMTITAAPGKNPVIDARSSSFAALNILGAKTARINGLRILGARLGINVNGSSVTITNSVISSARNYGIQVSGYGSSVSIVNCTITDNDGFGLGVFKPSSARVANSIIQDNDGTDIGGDGTRVVRNSLVGTGGFAGSNGNIGGDPQFVDADREDASLNNYRLKPTSPAIDAGDPADPDLPETDADGLPRSIDGRGTGKAAPDMGAHEYLPPGALTSNAIFPQIATGGVPAYRTSIVAVNTGSVEALASLSLTRSDGSPFPITVLNSPVAPARPAAAPPSLAVSRNGSSFSFGIPPGGTARYEVSTSGITISGYAKFASSVPVGGTALFRTTIGDVVLSEAGVGSSKPGRSFLIYIDNTNDGNSGYAIANPGSVPANVTATLRDNGGLQKASAGFRLDPGTHLAEFAFQRFPQAAPPGSGFEGSIEFSSDQPVAAVALRYDNPGQDVFSAIPVLVDEAATTLYFPQVADGGGYRTNFILLNPSASSTIAHLEFFGDDGSPLGLSIGGAAATNVDLRIEAKGAVHLITDGTPASTRVGWVRVTSPVAIGGSALFQTVGPGWIQSEAGVPASPAAGHFTTYVTSMGSTESGLALSNPNQTSVTVTLKLRDTTGLVVASTTISLNPLAHIARFFTQWFPAAGVDFEGTLEVLATDPVCGVALRYDNSQQNVFATLPIIVIP